MCDMTPDEARDARVELHHRPFRELFDLADRALETIAAMTTEHDYRVVTWEEVDGRYEVYNRTRLVSDWRDT